MTFRLSHLALLLAATTVFATASGVIATWRAADEEFHDVLDDDLESQARMLARLLAAEEIRPSDDALRKLLKRTFEPDEEETLWVSVHDLRTGDHVSNLERRTTLDSEGSGAISLRSDGHDWRGYQRKEGDLVIQLLRRDDLFEDLQEEMLEDIVAPAVIGSVVNLLLLAALMGVILWPLTRLVRELTARDADSLAPLEVRAPVREIAALRDTMNRLIGRVSVALQRERQFASDVAHELRTPLTTLKLELASGEPDHAALKLEVDRVTRVVGQLLTLARLEHAHWQQSFAALPLDDVVRRALERFGDEAARAGMTVRSALEPATIAGDATLLDILLQNLLKNVLVHCPAGTSIDVELRRQDGRALLSLSDNGPGISEAQRAGMTARFARLDSKGEGLGLGLAICHKVALAHGASLAFRARADGAPGLRVEVEFPIWSGPSRLM